MNQKIPYICGCTLAWFLLALKKDLFWLFKFFRVATLIIIVLSLVCADVTVLWALVIKVLRQCVIIENAYTNTYTVQTTNNWSKKKINQNLVRFDIILFFAYYSLNSSHNRHHWLGDVGGLHGTWLRSEANATTELIVRCWPPTCANSCRETESRCAIAKPLRLWHNTWGHCGILAFCVGRCWQYYYHW